ncbi:hypothetical protein D3C71_2038560 [compost metagenome]
MAAQQLHAQFLLQRLQGMGNRGLADPQAIGRRREAVQLGNGGEDLQLSEGHECLLILR